MICNTLPTLLFGLCGLICECLFPQALVTGSLPGFVDIIRNLNSPALLEDNVITQAKAAGKRMIFYGDDTWVKLFPKHFVEYDGTTSFFVSDYTEVSFPSKKHVAWGRGQDLAHSERGHVSVEAFIYMLGVVWRLRRPCPFTSSLTARGTSPDTGVRKFSGAPALEQPSTRDGAQRVRKGFPTQSRVNRVLTREWGLPTWTGWGGSLCPRQSPRPRELPGSSRLQVLL